MLLSSRKPPTRRVMLNEDEVVQFMQTRHAPFTFIHDAQFAPDMLTHVCKSKRVWSPTDSP